MWITYFFPIVLSIHRLQMSYENMNGVYPPHIPPVSVGGRGSLGAQSSSSPSSASSYSILTNPSAVRSTAGTSLFSQLGNGSISMTDVTLEQALEKVQELASENTNLRGKVYINLYQFILHVLETGQNVVCL